MANKTTIESKSAVNDNSQLSVVYTMEGGVTRNYVMKRYEPNTDAGDVDLGEVDFGKRGGLWIGIARLDETKNKYIFTKTREVMRALSEFRDGEDTAKTA